MSDEFGVIEPKRASVTVCGQAVEFGPITVERLPRFARAVRQILPMLQEVLRVDESTDPGVVTDILLDLAASHGERMAEAVAVALAPTLADVDDMRGRVNRMDPVEFLAACMTVVRVNVGFFARRLLPAVVQAAQTAQAAMPGAGQTPSTP